MKRNEFIEGLKEFRAACAILDTGMPNSNASERRAMQAKRRTLREKLEHAPWQEDEKGHVKER